MKIERVSENQVKIILNRTDLEARSIKITELAYGSEKAQELFRDIMERAHEECGFDSENLPLMIEAIPYSQDSITIIVTKVKNQDEFEERFKNMSRNSEPKLNSSQSHHDSGAGAQPKAHASSQPMHVFSFRSIDEAATVAAKLTLIMPQNYQTDEDADHLDDMLFKMDDRFYFVLSDLSAHSLEPLASEFGGQKHTNNMLSKYYLLEHGELLIRDNATQKLAKYLS